MENKDKWYAVQYANYWNIQDGPDYTDICVTDIEQVGEEQAEYNARLCASAPELRDMCDRMYEAWVTQEPDALKKVLKEYEQWTGKKRV